MRRAVVAVALLGVGAALTWWTFNTPGPHALAALGGGLLSTLGGGYLVAKVAFWLFDPAANT